jgi:hypothetical protein
MYVNKQYDIFEPNSVKPILNFYQNNILNKHFKQCDDVS